MAVRSFFICLTSVIGLSAAGCNASFPTEPSPAARIASLVIHYTPFGTRMVAGWDQPFTSRNFEAYTIDSDGVYANVTRQSTWTASHPDVIPLAGIPGSLTRAQAGTTTLIATYEGFVATLRVEVRPPDNPPHLEINLNGPRAVSLRLPRTSQIVDRNLVTWTSSDHEVATVDRFGNLEPHRPGNVRIIANYDGMSDLYWTSVPPRDR